MCEIEGCNQPVPAGTAFCDKCIAEIAVAMTQEEYDRTVRHSSQLEAEVDRLRDLLRQGHTMLTTLTYGKPPIGYTEEEKIWEMVQNMQRELYPAIYEEGEPC